MPIHSCKLPGGGSGYKYGNSGHCYPTREGALKQMRAMFHNGYKGDASSMEQAKADLSELSNDELNEFIGDTSIPYMTRVSFAELLKARKEGIPEQPNPTNYNSPVKMVNDEVLGKKDPVTTEDVNSDGGNFDGQAKKMENYTYNDCLGFLAIGALIGSILTYFTLYMI